MSAAATIEYVELWRRIQSVQLSAEPDRITWKWTDNGIYTASSAYKALFHGSTASPFWRLIWRSWAPDNAKFFLWLASLDRCWTADRLDRHGLQHHTACPLCNQAPKTMQHLLLACPFSRQVWHEILSWYRITDTPLPDSSSDFRDWFSLAVQNAPTSLRRGLASLAILTAWRIWKARNACVFNAAAPSVTLLVNDIKKDARGLAAAGAKGLSNLLPMP